MGLFRDVIRYVQLSRKTRVLHQQEADLTLQLEKLDTTDPERLFVIHERNVIHQQLADIESEVEDRRNNAQNDLDQYYEEKEWREQHPTTYQRTDTFLNRHLGPLPKNARILNPSLTEIREIESHNGALLVIWILMISVMATIHSTAPWLLKGLWALVFGGEITSDPSTFSFGHIASIVFLLTMVIFRNATNNLIYGIVIEGEQRFRMGFENWTWSQRGYSCLAACLQSMWLLLFFPIVCIPLICVPVPVLAYVYLREFKRTGDTEHATLVSAKLNARYLKSYLVISFTMALYPWIMTLVS